jgi:hypothetical protein
MKPLPLIAGFASVALFLGASLYAAKGDKVNDKPVSEKRMDKIERKLERAAVAEAAASAPQRQMMGAAAEPDRSRSDRGDRGDRGDQGYSSRSRSRDRGEYREPTTPADAKYDSFRVIVEKNIFNPTRIGRTRDRPEERAPRVDTISLVGTMQSEKGGVLAFFDSPDSSYRKTLREGQSVGEFKVQKITPNEVEVVRDGKPVTLKVGQQFRRPEGGDWSVANVEPRIEGASPGSAASVISAEPPPIPADASDALRRLMEARAKQLKQ